MMFRSDLGQSVLHWTQCVAATVVAALGRLLRPRVVRLHEDADGGFSVRSRAGAQPLIFADGKLSGGPLAQLCRGSRVEFVLAPKRFLLRPFELPVRAAEFLDGVVRAQVDRLTPWAAAEAIFGCTRPVPAGSDRVSTTIVATTRAMVSPFVRAVTPYHPASIAILAEANGTDVKVFEQQARGLLDAARLGRALLLVLVLAILAAVAAAGTSLYMADRLAVRQAEIDRQIAARRDALRAGQLVGDRSAFSALERRKYDQAAAVLAIEELSKLLPDHTYVTELHLSDGKLQVVGLTRDAPSLIRLIEQTGRFTRATFFAPTTRSPADAGERFHIETRVEPIHEVKP